MTRSLTPVRVAGAMAATCALVMVAPLAASAAVSGWLGTNGEVWSDAANWSPAGVPAQGDTFLTFENPASDRSNNDVADLFQLRGAYFDVPVMELLGSRLYFVSSVADDGIDVESGVVTITAGIRTTGDTTFQVQEGAALHLPSDVVVEDSTLEFAIAGEATIGSLDGNGFAGAVRKTQGGSLTIEGGSGGVGPEFQGISVEDGYLVVTGDAGGSSFTASGGVLSGDLGGILERVTVTGGTVAPGATPGGTDLTQMVIWNGLSGSEGTLEFGLSGPDNDSISLLEGTAIDGLTLSLDLQSPAAAGDQWTIIEQDRDLPFSASFVGTDGAEVVEGEPFVSNGHRYTLETVGLTVVVTYLGAVPPPPAPALPATGTNPALPLGIAAIALLGGLAMLLRRRSA